MNGFPSDQVLEMVQLAGEIKIHDFILQSRALLQESVSSTRDVMMNDNQETSAPRFAESSLHEVKTRRGFLKALFANAALAGIASAVEPVVSLTKSTNSLNAAGGKSAVPVKPSEKLANYTWLPEAINRPTGVARGIFPGRVVWIHDPAAAKWCGDRQNVGKAWWLDESTDQSRVDRMVSKAITSLTGISDESKAWDALFRYHNERIKGGEEGASSRGSRCHQD